MFTITSGYNKSYLTKWMYLDILNKRFLLGKYVNNKHD